MPIDEREWTLTRDVGHPHFGVAGGPSLPEHDEVKVVPLARAVAAEQQAAELERQLAQTETTYEGVSADCATETTRAEAAEAERDALKEALKFYADGSNYIFAAVDATGDEWSSPVHEDEGEIARAALAASVSKEEARDDA